jgi:hypothetical protein
MRARAWGALAAALLVALSVVSAQMPDPKQMSGIPLPSPDVPKGSVSIRLVRGELSNYVSGHPVELSVGDRTETIKTDQEGRATFSGISPGVPVRAVAIVDGERLETQAFALPPEVGIRMVLVAGAGAGAGPTGAAMSAPPSAAVPGELAFGGNSRIQIEFDDDALEVFYLLDLVNADAAPVNPKNELAFELPEGAEQAASLEGSSPQVAVKGRMVTISGPFAPGVTPVHLAFSMSPAGAARTLVQSFPVAWLSVQVVVPQIGSLAMSSPQFTSSTERNGEGQPFLLGAGGALAAGQEFSLALSGLPNRSHAGRYATLAIALLVLGWGVFVATSGRAESGDAARQAQLHERRDKLMADLVRVEQQFRSGALEAARYDARRSDLVSQLERVYGELDEHAGPGAGQGLPA